MLLFCTPRCDLTRLQALDVNIGPVILQRKVERTRSYILRCCLARAFILPLQVGRSELRLRRRERMRNGDTQTVPFAPRGLGLVWRGGGVLSPGCCLDGWWRAMLGRVFGDGLLRPSLARRRAERPSVGLATRWGWSKEGVRHQSERELVKEVLPLWRIYCIEHA
jgi:hypothetical protein